MILLSLQGIQKSFGTNEVLRDASLVLQDGQRMGLVGVNGCGKSTLMKIIAGIETADGGTMTMQKGLKLGYLAQQGQVGEGRTVLEELEFCLPARDHTAQEVESAETARSISAFLRSQPEQARNIFIRRYWYCDATADIAKRYGIGESKVRVTLHRMRTKLKAYLEKEGVCL